MDLRDSTERARSRFCPNGGESVCDHGDEQIDEPKIEHNEANDKKEARNEKLRVDHGVH
jgi:hypothetical protein